MSTVTYTHADELDSSALLDVYYNENTRELTLNLNDTYYRYPNVPKNVWDGLVEAKSAGTYYRETIKKNYGPSERLDYLSWNDFEEVEVEASNVINVPANRWGGYATTTTPKALVETPQTVVHNNVFNLKSDSQYSLRKHAVTFEVNGVRRTHNLKAESVDEAVEAVHEIADMLSLTFVVKEVTVYFD